VLVTKVCAHEDAIVYRENLFQGEVEPWYEMPNGVLANHPAFTQANSLFLGHVEPGLRSFSLGLLGNLRIQTIRHRRCR
jgi:hypothetical protein